MAFPISRAVGQQDLVAPVGTAKTYKICLPLTGEIIGPYIFDCCIDTLQEIYTERGIRGGFVYDRKALQERFVGPAGNDPVLCWFGWDPEGRKQVAYLRLVTRS